MHTLHSRTTNFCYNCIACLLFLFSTQPTAAQDVYLCVWRNPERTMTKIFPNARDYKTITLRITAEQRERIETNIGFKLLPGQRDQFQYFELTGANGKKVGTIIAASQKGEYGAIEFIVGLDTNRLIKGIYIQRSREKDTAFKEKSFLDLFIGKTIPDACAFAERTYKGQRTTGVNAIFKGLKKEHAVLYELVEKK